MKWYLICRIIFSASACVGVGLISIWKYCWKHLKRDKCVLWGTQGPDLWKDSKCKGNDIELWFSWLKEDQRKRCHTTPHPLQDILMSSEHGGCKKPCARFDCWIVIGDDNLCECVSLLLFLFCYSSGWQISLLFHEKRAVAYMNRRCVCMRKYDL